MTPDTDHDAHQDGHDRSHHGVQPDAIARQPVTVAVAAAGWRLERWAGDRLDFIDGAGGRERDVELRRAFPVSGPLGPVAVLSAGGGELAWIESLADAPAPLRALVEAVLATREPVDVITAIDAIGDGRPADWTVNTTQGPRRFRVAHTADVVHRPDGSICVIDTTGVRHEIPNPAALDAPSRRRLERLG